MAAVGGGPAYVAQAITKAYSGMVHPLSWIGEDASGEAYLEQLARSGVACQGMAKVAGARTPISVLAYDPRAIAPASTTRACQPQSASRKTRRR